MIEIKSNLLKLIKESKSIKGEEEELWKDRVNNEMTIEEMRELYNILTEEKESLEDIKNWNIKSSKILIFIPKFNFRDLEFIVLREFFEEEGFQITTASTELKSKGIYGTLAHHDRTIDSENISNHDAIVFLSWRLEKTNNLKEIAQNYLTDWKIVAIIGTLVNSFNWKSSANKIKSLNSLNSPREEQKATQENRENLILERYSGNIEAFTLKVIEALRSS